MCCKVLRAARHAYLPITQPSLHHFTCNISLCSHVPRFSTPTTQPVPSFAELSLYFHHRRYCKCKLHQRSIHQKLYNGDHSENGHNSNSCKVRLKIAYPRLRDIDTDFTPQSTAIRQCYSGSQRSEWPCLLYPKDDTGKRFKRACGRPPTRPRRRLPLIHHNL